MTQRALIPAAGLLAMLSVGDGLRPVTAGRAAPATTSPVGITVASQIALVAPEQAGKLTELAVKDGDPVEADQVLFRLNSTLEQLEVERLQALTESDLFERRAQKTLEYAQRQADRVRDLRDEDISSERDMQVQQHELDLARLAVEQAALDKRQVLNQLAQARELLEQRTVRAPFAGIVTARFKANGEAVEKFAPVVEVMDLDPLWIEFECPITSQHLFQRGGSCWVAPAMRPEDVRKAEILFVSPKATASSHSFMIRASVPNADLAWKTGLKMTIEPDSGGDPPSRPGK